MSLVQTDEVRAASEEPNEPEGPGAIGAMVVVAPLGWASWAGVAALLGAGTLAKVLAGLALASLPLAARVAWVWRQP